MRNRLKLIFAKSNLKGLFMNSLHNYGVTIYNYKYLIWVQLVFTEF